MDEALFHGNLVQSNRILYTASMFAKNHLIYLQEAGELFALKEHTSQREQLQSYLFFEVLDGEGILQYGENEYYLKKDYCAFIDCRKKYSHSSSKEHLWHLQWVHFYGPTMNGIYEKYLNRGGVPCFKTDEAGKYTELLQEVYHIANKDSDVRDMMIFEKLTALLTLAMIESRKGNNEVQEATSTQAKLLEIKKFLDEEYKQKVSLDQLEEKFYINKYYLTRIFKEKYGISINNYVIQRRITEAKYQLRFTGKTIEEIGHSCGMADPSYFNRVFKKVEGISPREFRRLWSK